MLSPAQIDARRGKLTASRVACLMTGNAEKIMQLYLEMIGEAEEEDLSRVWAVQLGSSTEELNLRWYEMKSGNALSRQGEIVVHPMFSWVACTLDAWDDVIKCPVEAKHVGGREPLEVVIDRYQPQMQWQMLVTDATQCALSVIMGASEPIIEYINCDDIYISEMIVRGKQFMEFVRKRQPPVVLPAVPPPIDASKVYDMASSNEWGDAAGTWRDTRNSFERCRDAEKILKSLVPADAKKVHGHGVIITRDRAGRLSLREAT